MLIIKPSAIGDVVHALPVLNLVRRRWPVAHVAWLVTPACAGLLDGHPQLDEVILFDRKRLGRGWRDRAALRELFSFSRALRARRFDLVVDLQGLFRSGWFTYVTGAPVRVGLSDAREAAPLSYTRVVPVGTPERHAIDRYLRVAEALGCGRGPVEYVFPTTDADRAYVAGLLPAGTPYAVLLPGANWATKRWPVERFADVARALRARFGIEPVVAGGPADAALAPQVGATDLTGRTNLRQLVALIERAAIVIGNDTGPMHIAAALGRPLVTPFGPTNLARTGPYRRPGSVVRLDIPCSPCYSRRCAHTTCLHALDADVVVRAVVEQLGVVKPEGDGIVD